MIQSMTGFAAVAQDTEAHTISFDIRSVNNRGLDLKIRIPDGIDGLEQSLRTRITKAITRGAVNVNVRVSGRQTNDIVPRLNTGVLQSMLDALAEIEQHAMDRQINLAPSTATDILALRGVVEMADQSHDFGDGLKADIETMCDAALDQFITSRKDEGRTLSRVLADAVDQIETLVAQATSLLPQRQSRINSTFQDALTRLSAHNSDIDQDRVAQEIAMLLIKQDVKEELDRLAAHIAAARDLLTAGGAIGRRFDFLTQEFNREANTLCSKAQHSELSQIGLELKTVIDQIREQVQNVE